MPASSTFTDREIETPIPATVSKLTLIPLHHLLLVRPDHEPKQLGSLLIPDSAARSIARNRMGTVLDCGPGFLRRDETPVPMICQPGDRVMFRRDKGTEVEQGSEILLLINQDEVLAILR